MESTEIPVVIIGAGLAGLACALTLQQNGVPFLLLEKESEVGGRLKTTKEHGFLFDHGFQVLLTSYPELKNFLDLSSLQLQPFNSGALIYTPQKIRLLANPLLHPSQLLSETLSNLVSLKDKALVLKLVLNLHANCSKNSGPVSTFTFLKSFGFSDDFIELFWRPFCAGVFLDKDLEVSSEHFLFLIKNFSAGRVAVPKNGMQEIPQQMANRIDKNKIRLGVGIKDFSAKAVVLNGGEQIAARAVVCAFDPLSSLDVANVQYRAVTNYYFSTEKSLPWKKWLLLIPPQYGFNINNVCIMSDVSAAYSSLGKQLISVSVVGAHEPGEAVVADELKQIAGTEFNLKFVKKFKILKALPKNFTHEETSIQNGIYFCGDHLGGPSINGALMSGRKTAEKLLGFT